MELLGGEVEGLGEVGGMRLEVGGFDGLQQWVQQSQQVLLMDAV